MKRELYRTTKHEFLSALFLSSRRYRVNKYEDKDRRDLESTSKLHSVEVKIRPCIHEMDFTILYKLLFYFVNVLILKTLIYFINNLIEKDI